MLESFRSSMQLEMQLQTRWTFAVDIELQYGQGTMAFFVTILRMCIHVYRPGFETRNAYSRLSLIEKASIWISVAYRQCWNSASQHVIQLKHIDANDNTWRFYTRFKTDTCFLFPLFPIERTVFRWLKSVWLFHRWKFLGKWNEKTMGIVEYPLNISSVFPLN